MENKIIIGLSNAVFLNSFTVFPEYLISVSAIYGLIVTVLIAYNTYNLMIQKALSECIALMLLMSCYLLINDDLVLTNFLTFKNSLVNDYFTYFTKIVVGFVSALYFLITANALKNLRLTSLEYLAILLFAVFGLILLCESSDFITAYLAIELFSLSFFILAGFKKSSIYSIDSGIKYYITGAISSAFFLFGITFIYVFCGSIHFHDLSELNWASSEARNSTQAWKAWVELEQNMSILNSISFSIGADLRKFIDFCVNFTNNQLLVYKLSSQVRFYQDMVSMLHIRLANLDPEQRKDLIAFIFVNTLQAGVEGNNLLIHLLPIADTKQSISILFENHTFFNSVTKEQLSFLRYMTDSLSELIQTKRFSERNLLRLVYSLKNHNPSLIYDSIIRPTPEFKAADPAGYWMLCNNYWATFIETIQRLKYILQTFEAAVAKTELISDYRLLEGYLQHYPELARLLGLDEATVEKDPNLASLRRAYYSTRIREINRIVLFLELFLMSMGAINPEIVETLLAQYSPKTDT